MGKSNKGQKASKTGKDGARFKVKQNNTRKPSSQAPPSGGARLSTPSKMTTYTVPPATWPSSMPYLAVSHQSPNLTADQQSIIQPTTLRESSSDTSHKNNITNEEIYSIPSLTTFSPTTNPLIQIRPITDPKHPAYPQCGLFAHKALPPGTHIVDYTGMIHHCPLPTCSTSDYDLAFLDRNASLAIDSASMGNEGRFVNDYHGIRDDGPNAVFEEYFVKTRAAKGGKEVWQARMGIWVAPSKSGGLGIAKGEEICVSYGKGWWRARRSLMEDQSDDVEVENVE